MFHLNDANSLKHRPTDKLSLSHQPTFESLTELSVEQDNDGVKHSSFVNILSNLRPHAPTSVSVSISVRMSASIFKALLHPYL